MSLRTSGYITSFSKYVWTVSSSMMRVAILPLVVVAFSPALWKSRESFRTGRWPSWRAAFASVVVGGSVSGGGWRA